jgi:hypothetical protein
LQLLDQGQNPCQAWVSPSSAFHQLLLSFVNGHSWKLKNVEGALTRQTAKLPKQQRLQVEHLRKSGQTFRRIIMNDAIYYTLNCIAGSIIVVAYVLELSVVF